MESMMPYPDMLISSAKNKGVFKRPPTEMTWESNRYTGYPKHGHSIEKNEDQKCEWISLMENLQETIEFPLKCGVFL
jgi:hypothetical protein